MTVTVKPLVQIEVAGDVCLLRLNDPPTLNAASLEMVEQLSAALEEAGRSMRAVVLTGAGRGFCTGANLGGTLDPELPDYDAGLFLETHYNPLMLTIRDLPIPIVTAVNGPAAGIGAAIALAGDMIVAAQSSYFLQAFARIGLIPDGGSAFLLVRAVGRPRAMEMMLLGEKVDAAQAFQWGLVNRLVPDELLMDEALKLAVRLARGPTTALGMARRITWDSLESSFGDMLRSERILQCAAGRTEDHREGVRAFFAKRPAEFTGS